MRVAEGDREGALTAYADILAIANRLAAADPGNALWSRDVYVSLFNIGRLHETGGERTKAAALYSEAIDLNARLVALDPGNTQWANDRRLLEGRLAKIKRQ